MDKNNNENKDFWRCNKCGNVLAGYFDGNEFRTKTLNGQDIVISDFGAAEISAMCRHCGNKNDFSGKDAIIEKETVLMQQSDELKDEGYYRRLT